ncbi:transcriptional regulator [Corallococcus sp. H22C18031201]|uniref:winged helix-turn-helix transcriptional regulator n=1 Tax=Citreicoccus inhibens TaxID=2849499 RepID=UPI000E7466E2|nr:helix-turn-helix domain-containing protein [Citreicoccus inhibens]MBU8894258.1 helix-turn-helix transcriptional regulator [Citreicoccus inhibens]RJS23052.1 transcriptional regulator [Corallococcus sp. H22C18031201]
MPAVFKNLAPPEQACPVNLLMSMLGGPWTMYILWTLLDEGPQRFGALRRRVSGISARVLTERLRMLESEGFVHRLVEDVVPPEVTYAPTERLHRLRDAIARLREVATEWHADSGRPRRRPPRVTPPETAPRPR